jgi:hemolysin III
MRLSPAAPERPQSRGEEIANSISHGLPLLAALVGAPFLIAHWARNGDAAVVVGASLFAATVIFLYLASTLYHALPAGRGKRVFRVIDHSAIFLLIAGTYTPFTLGVLRGAWGWTLFGLVWGLAVIGVALKASGRASHPVLSTGLYLVMGWIVLIAAEPLISRVSTEGLLWLAAGGLCYTAGVAFFATDSRLRFGHFIWHLFVAAGTASHYFAVLWHAA